MNKELTKNDWLFKQNLMEKFNSLIKKEQENRAELSTIYLTLKVDYMTKHEFAQWSKRYDLPDHYKGL